MSGDAYHITAPAPGGEGAAAPWQSALKRAGLIGARHLDYINAHGTSTQVGDEVELERRAIAFSAMPAARIRCPMSSTKSAVGHLLGAAGAVEAVYFDSGIGDQIVPPILNLDNPSVTTFDRSRAAYQARKREVEFGKPGKILRLRRHQRIAGVSSGRLARFWLRGAFQRNPARLARRPSVNSPHSMIVWSAGPVGPLPARRRRISPTCAFRRDNYGQLREMT